MSKGTHLLGVSVGVESVALAYAALVAWLTASPTQEHNWVLAAALFALAIPLGWQAIDLAVRDRRSLAHLLTGVAGPNLALLALAVSGPLDHGPSPYGLPAAVTALIAVTMVGLALRERRLAQGQAPHPHCV